MAEDSAAPLREPPVREMEPAGDAFVVHLRGELDLYNAEQVREALGTALESAPRRIVIDMADVEFVDSTALGVLIEARSRLGNHGLLLAAPQIETRRALEVSGLDRHLPLYDSVEAALAT
jgi:anti-sigma B factor antagonist